MQIDLMGRVKNVYLPYSKSLLPLFEAIINSIYAIQESGKKGKIDIYVQREDSLEFASEEPHKNITGFNIIDNGIGFNEENYRSFLISDSTIKANRGAKGIGRLLWLKAFEFVKVTSHYEKDGEMYKRSFDFRLNDQGIINDIVEDSESNETFTSVQLINFRKNYQLACPKKLSIIADRIIEHCLDYFLLDNSPDIFLQDENDTLSLQQIFKENIFLHIKQETFDCKNWKFNVTSLKLYSSDDSKHKIHYCANNREVLTENLGNEVIDLNRKLTDENGNLFVYHAYVSSVFLDERVNQERTDFNLSSDSSTVFENELTRVEIQKAAIQLVREQLKPYLEEIKIKKEEEVIEYIQKNAPQFRHLIKYKDNLVDSIPYGITSDKLNLELYKFNARVEKSIRETGKRLLDFEIEDYDDYENYKKSFTNYVDDINELGKSKLAEYIIHRKLILELFANRLNKRDGEHYELEESIHEIIFPLKTISDEVKYSQQNLWMIDEKLTFHKFLSSDKPLNTIDELNTSSADRPDLLIYDTPFLFVESDSPFNSVTIIEFKRPMRKNYSGDDSDPIKQVYGYIRKIRQNDRVDSSGRPIIITDTTRFFCYVICDLTKKMQEICLDNSLTVAPDNMGYFGYNSNHSAYIEVISFDKLLNDAKKRNMILFHQLGLPD